MYNSESQTTNGQQADGERSGIAATVSPDMLESVIASSPQTYRTGEDQPSLVHGAVIGTVTGWNDAGQPLVIADEISDDAFPARTVVAASQLQPGMQVVLLFECGDPSRPIVMAALSETPSNGTANIQLPILSGEKVKAMVDDDRLVLRADREIVLQCGKASLTLTRAGKVILRGAYVLSRSTGVNRIKGGSVQIN